MASKKPPSIKAPSSSWMKNVAKSLGGITLDEVKSHLPGVTETIESGHTTIKSGKELLDKIKDSKGIDKLNVINANASTYVGHVKKLKTNIIEDLKTGNLNNTTRGEDDFDFGFNEDDFNFDVDFGDDSDVDDFDDSNVVVPDITINSNISANNPMVKAVERSNDITEGIAVDTAKRDVAIAEAHMALSGELASKLSGNMGTINDNIGLIVEFNNNVMSEFAKTSLSYYESSLSIMNSMLEEVRKISSPQQRTTEREDPFSIRNVFSYDDGFDIGAYVNQVKKNIKRESNSSTMASMASMLLNDEMINMFVNNPIGAALGMFINLPDGFNKILETFDKNVSSFIPAMMAKFADRANDQKDMSFFGDIKRTLFKVLGVSSSPTVKEFDLSNYERGQIPFDGITKKSIVEVIPGYLSKILAAVSNTQPIAYDYETGKFINVHKATSDFYEQSKRRTLYEFDSYSTIKDAVKEATKGDEEHQKELISKLEVGMLRLANSKGVIDYRDLTSTTNGLLAMFNSENDKYNPNIVANTVSDDDLKLLSTIFATHLTDSEKMKTFAGSDKMAAREVHSELIRKTIINNPGLATLLGSDLYKNLDVVIDTNTGKMDRNATPQDPRLVELKQHLIANKSTSIPSEFEDVTPDSEVEDILKKNKEQKKRKKFSLFDDESKNPIVRVLAKILDRPMGIIHEGVNKMGTMFHDIIFGADPNDPKKNKDPIITRIKKRMDGFYNWIREKLFGKEGFFTQIKESDFYKNITAKFKGFGDWFKSGLFGTETDGVYSGGLFSEVGNVFRGYKDKTVNYFKGEGGVFDKTKESLFNIKDTVRESFNDAFYGNDPDYVSGKGAQEGHSVKDTIDGAAGVLKSGFQNFANMIFGPKTYKDGTQNQTYVDMNNLMSHVKDNAPSALANGIIGAGTAAFLSATSSGLLGGLVLGPVGGAAVGIAGTLLMRSKTFTDTMFGHENAETGEYIEGFISKKTQDWFKDNKGTLIGGAAIGGVAGLMGAGALPAFILGGPISGAILGIAGGLVLKSNAFQELMFGSDDKQGLIDKAFSGFAGNSDSETKRLTIGTIGAGSLTGLGLFGLLGLNPVVGALAGAGVGIAAASKKFSEKIFGTPDENGKRHGGILEKTVSGAAETMLKPLLIGAKSTMNYIANWFDRGIKEPMLEIVEYSFEGFKGAGKKLLETLGKAFSETRLGKWLIGIGDHIKNAFKAVGKHLLNFGKNILKASGKLLLNAISAPFRLLAFGTRQLSRLFIDKDTYADMEARRKGRLADIKERAKARQQELAEYKNKLSNTDILSRFGDNMSRRDAERAMADKYGSDYKKASKMEKAKINTAEAQAQDTAEVKDNTSRLVVTLEKIFNFLTGKNKYNNSNGDNTITSNTTTQTDNVLRGDDSYIYSYGSDTASNDGTPGISMDDIDFGGGNNSEPPISKPNLNGQFETSTGGKKKDPTDILRSDGKVDKNKLDPSKNPNVAESAEGAKQGLTDALSSKGSPLSGIIPVFGKLGLILKGVELIAPVLPLLGLMFFKMVTDPVGYFEGVLNVWRTVFEEATKLVFKPLFKFLESKGYTASGTTKENVKDLKATNELITKSNGATLQSSEVMNPFADTLLSEIENSERGESRSKLTGFLSSGFYDEYKSNYETKKRHKSYKESAQNALASYEAGTINLSHDQLEKLQYYANLDDKDLKVTAADTASYYIKGGLDNMHPISASFEVINKLITKAGILDKEDESAAQGKSSAIGESNVEENSPYYLHKGEGVLTASANHLFGGAETTAGVLNAYARSNMGKTDSSALLSILSGTLNTLNKPSEWNGIAGIMLDMLADDNYNMDDMTTFITDVRENTQDVSDSNYWKLDDSSAKKYGGFGKALFKMVRFVNYPIRMIDKTLENVADDVTVYEKKASEESRDDSIFNKIRTSVSNTINSVTSFISNAKDTIVDAATNIADKTGLSSVVDGAGTVYDKLKGTVSDAINQLKGVFGGNTTDEKGVGGSDETIDIGMTGNEYYKFPSSSIPVSDVNPDRVFSNGTHSKHWGLDLHVRDRSNPLIRSTTHGKVVFAGVSNSGINKSYGNMVQIQDENGMYHLYGHLASLGIKTGDVVQPGSVLGVEGTTGASSGNHLHYEVGTGYNPGGRLSGRVHPAEYMEGYNRGDKVIRATPVEDYVAQSYWNGGSGNRSVSVTNNPSTGAYSSSAVNTNPNEGTLLDRLYAPFTQFNSSLKNLINGEDPGKVSATDYGFASDQKYTSTSLAGDSNAEKIWNYLLSAGYSKEGAAGIMGNLRAESGLAPNNLENQYNTKTGWSDEEYTSRVDSGLYPESKFNNDRYGYGLAQWTDESRKPGLYAAAKAAGTSIGDLGMQLNHLVYEFTQKYPTLDSMARGGSSLYDVSKYMVRKFEVPQGYNTKAVWDKRASMGQEYYDKFAVGGSEEDTEIGTITPNTVRVSTTSTNNSTLQTIIVYLIQIAKNTGMSAAELSEIRRNQKKTVAAIEKQKPQTSIVSDSPESSEMYDIANKAKRKNSSQSRRSYELAKSIAQGF